MKYITVEMLESRLACADQIELFKATFKTGMAALNKTNKAKAVKAGLIFSFCAVFLRDLEHKNFEVVRDPALQQYMAAYRSALKRYAASEHNADARKELAASCDPVWKQYESVSNEALLAALIAQGEAA